MYPVNDMMGSGPYVFNFDINVLNFILEAEKT